jgi:hypothetical protein
MTLTIEVPDDVALLVAALPEAERQYIALAALREAALGRDGGQEDGSDAAALRPVTDVMEFYGFAKDQPGSVGDDVDGYLRALRDEWEDRETGLRRDG